MRTAFLALIFSLIFVSSVSALSLNSDSNQVYVRGTEGKVYLWIVNTDGVEKTAAFNADLGKLNGFFEQDAIIVPERGSKGTWLKFRAPPCFRGTERVDVTADVCDEYGNCQYLTKTIIVSATPAESCNAYTNQHVPMDNYVGPRDYGDGSLAGSSLSYASYYDPTDFMVELSGNDFCMKIKPGENARKPFTVINRGAASSFELRTVGSDNEIISMVSPRSMSLRRGEAQEVWVSLQPQWTEGGRHYVSLQVLRKGVIVGESPICVDVQDVFEAQVRLPQKVSGKQCEAISFQGSVENLGTARDSFEIEVPGYAEVSPQFIDLNAGEKALFSVMIPENALRSGDNRVLVTARSSAKGLVGQAEILVNAASCAAVFIPVTPVVVGAGDRITDITVAVTNAFDTPLYNVTGDVEGIPAAWTVESNTIPVIEPGNTQTLRIRLTQTTDEEALNPVLVVKSNGVEISRTPLEPIRASGITGLFTALSANSLLLALLILAALVVIVLLARGRQPAETPSGDAPTAPKPDKSSFPAVFKQKLAEMKRVASK